MHQLITDGWKTKGGNLKCQLKVYSNGFKLSVSFVFIVRYKLETAFKGF